MSYWTEEKKTKSCGLYIRIYIRLLCGYDCWCMDFMKDKIKFFWDYPIKMEESMWYLLIGFFVMIWMWMIIS